MSKRLLIAVFAALLGSASLHATENILVASSRSNSLEEFNTSGTWLRTFATTGPYAPVALAQSPLTGEIFVTTIWASGASMGQLTNKILRYGPTGKFDVNWDTFTVECSYCPTTQTQSLLFDSSGNLWVATAYGEDSGAPIYIFKYLAADLTKPNPTTLTLPIMATMKRGNQMAFNKPGDLCIAGFLDEDVQCFDASTGTKTADYSTEIHASSISPTIEPGGLAFDGANRMYLTSVFGGQVAAEVKPGGPIVLLATLATPPNELNGNLVLRGPGTGGGLTPPILPILPVAPVASSGGLGNLYTSAFHFPAPPPIFSTPDPIYEVSIGSGTVTNFIDGTAAPALGNDHIWGAYWMIFYCDSCASSPLLFPLFP